MLCAGFAEQGIIGLSSRVLMALHFYNNQIHRMLGGWLNEKIHNDVLKTYFKNYSYNLINI